MRLRANASAAACMWASVALAQGVAEDRPSPIGTWVVILGGLAAAAGLGYWAVRYIQTNPKAVADQMGRLGVEYPDPNAPPDVPTTTAAPQPQILLDAPAPRAFLSGPNGRIELRQGETILGRSQLGEQAVSRQHASVRMESGRITVRDLDSRNGTFLNGMRLTTESPLVAGDEIQLGPVVLRLEVEP